MLTVQRPSKMCVLRSHITPLLSMWNLIQSDHFVQYALNSTYIRLHIYTLHHCMHSRFAIVDMWWILSFITGQNMVSPHVLAYWLLLWQRSSEMAWKCQHVGDMYVKYDGSSCIWTKCMTVNIESQQLFWKYTCSHTYLIYPYGPCLCQTPM